MNNPTIKIHKFPFVYIVNMGRRSTQVLITPYMTW